MYGMGERSVVQIAEALDSGLAVKDITFIDGTVYKTRNREDIYDAIELPHSMRRLSRTSAPMRKAFIHSTAIPIRFPASGSCETYDEKMYRCAESAAEPVVKT